MLRLKPASNTFWTAYGLLSCAVLWGTDTVCIQSGRLLLRHEALDLKEEIAPDLAVVSDVHVSFDAQTLLVSAKRAPSDLSQIYEIHVAGGLAKQVTNCLNDCSNAAYLPDGKIVFTVHAAGGSYIACIQPAGGEFERITFGPGDYQLEGVLPDGRILLTFGGTLYGMRPDGTGLESIRCNHDKPARLRHTDSQRVELVVQPKPRRLWSTLKPELGVGYFISLDSRISSPDVGGRLRTVPVSVRVLTLNSDGTVCKLGIAPVETDGSFYVAVPADNPVRFELLDAAGNSLRRENTWIWARSGEERGCAGCHAEKALAPRNHWPLTLKRFDTPTKMTGEMHAK